MTKADQEFDQYGKRLLAPLRPAPAMDAQIAAREREKFLSSAALVRKEISIKSAGEINQPENPIHRFAGCKLSISLIKAAFAILIALVILVGSSLTVYASQGSLPGEPLYPLKSWSEDVRLNLTFSTSGKLDLMLDYTNRRMGEISRMLAKGQAVPGHTSERYQAELEQALELAATMDDTHMQQALARIKSQAENQGMTIEELLSRLPPQAEPAILHLQERLDEQVDLTELGEKNPQGFRSEMHTRQRNHQKSPKHTPGPGNNSPLTSPSTPASGQDGTGSGGGGYQATDVPGHGNQGGGQGKNTPGNGNH